MRIGRGNPAFFIFDFLIWFKYSGPFLRTNTLYDEIHKMSLEYHSRLSHKIADRTLEMQNDDRSHQLLYSVLGIDGKEGDLIDLYQNKGRFLYNYAGSFLENAARACFIAKDPNAKIARIPNRISHRPKQFEIDCLTTTGEAIEIKWRDATTDGDHISKENTRIQAISDAGFTPIRVMFFYPNRLQSIKIQKALESVYHNVGGQYYYGDKAWDYIFQYTGIDLLRILKRISNEKGLSI